MTDLRLEFIDAVFTRPSIRGKLDLLLGVEATFSVRVGGHVIHREPMFPVVELSQALSSWLDGVAVRDFEFDSMEWDDVRQVWFGQQRSGQWVGSVVQTKVR